MAPSPAETSLATSLRLPCFGLDPLTTRGLAQCVQQWRREQQRLSLVCACSVRMGHALRGSLSTLALRTVLAAVAVARRSTAISGPGLVLPGALAWGGQRHRDYSLPLSPPSPQLRGRGFCSSLPLLYLGASWGIWERSRVHVPTLGCPLAFSPQLREAAVLRTVVEAQAAEGVHARAHRWMQPPSITERSIDLHYGFPAPCQEERRGSPESLQLLAGHPLQSQDCSWDPATLGAPRDPLLQSL